MTRIFHLIWLVLLLGTSGCAWLEPPAWPLLGDTESEAYYLDRMTVKRDHDGHYRYRIKVVPCRAEDASECVQNRRTLQALFVEMDCRAQTVTVLAHDVIDPTGKPLFRRNLTAPPPQPILPGSMHRVAYDYLCGDSDISPTHQH